MFNISADRKSSFPLSVFLPEEAVESWQRAHARDLGSTERYAVAKMALFEAFDHRPAPEAMTEEVCVQAGDVESILATLDIG